MPTGGRQTVSETQNKPERKKTALNWLRKPFDDAANDVAKDIFKLPIAGIGLFLLYVLVNPFMCGMGYKSYCASSEQPPKPAGLPKHLDATEKTEVAAPKLPEPKISPVPQKPIAAPLPVPPPGAPPKPNDEQARQSESDRRLAELHKRADEIQGGRRILAKTLAILRDLSDYDRLRYSDTERLDEQVLQLARRILLASRNGIDSSNKDDVPILIKVTGISGELNRIVADKLSSALVREELMIAEDNNAEIVLSVIVSMGRLPGEALPGESSQKGGAWIKLSVDSKWSRIQKGGLRACKREYKGMSTTFLTDIDYASLFDPCISEIAQHIRSLL